MSGVSHPIEGRALGCALLAVVVTAVLSRIGLLTVPAHFDEFYHLLPARSLNAGQGFGILDGEYTRGAIFTRGLALHLQLLGDDSLLTARLFPLFFASLIPVVLFAWVNRHAGWAIASVAVALCILWPAGIQEAQFVRFYCLHVLAFLIAAISVFEMMRADGTRQSLWALAAIAAFALAFSVQLATLIGMAGVGLWWAGRHAVPAIARHRSRYWVLGLGVPAAILSVVALYQAGFLQKAWAFYRWVPAHSEDFRDDTLFYARHLLGQYGALWVGIPVVLVLAIRRLPDLGTFCATVFLVAFLTHSFGAFKAPRYISYVMPLLFVLMATGLVAAAEGVFHAVSRRLGTNAPVAGAAATALVAGVLISGTFLTPALRLATGMAPMTRPDWSGVASVVGDWDQVPFRITTRELDTIAYLGDYDLLVSRSRLSEVPPFTQFAVDYRTGRPIVSTTEAVDQVMRCVPEGVIVADPGWWRKSGWQAHLAPTLQRPGFRHQIREDADNFVLYWQAPPPGDLACDLPGL